MDKKIPIISYALKHMEILNRDTILTSFSNEAVKNLSVINFILSQEWMFFQTGLDSCFDIHILTWFKLLSWLFEIADSAGHTIIENAARQNSNVMIRYSCQRHEHSRELDRKYLSSYSAVQLFLAKSSVTYRRKISLAISNKLSPRGRLSWFCSTTWNGRKYLFSSASPKRFNSRATCRHRVSLCSLSSKFSSSSLVSSLSVVLIVSIDCFRCY